MRRRSTTGSPYLRHRAGSRRTLLLAGLLGTIAVAGVNPAAAQSGVAGKESVARLVLKEGLVPNAKLGGVTGVADERGHRILAEDLSVVQPVLVAVVAVDPAIPVKASLMKGKWNEPLRSGTTDARGELFFRIRTEGNMGVLVQAAGERPAEYRLAVWVGPEMPGEPPSPFTSKATSKTAAGSAWFPGATMLLVGAVAIGVFVGGAFVMRRRSGAGSCALVAACVLLVPFPAAAQQLKELLPKDLDGDVLGDMYDRHIATPTNKGFEKLTNPQSWDPAQWKKAYELLTTEDKGYDEDYNPPGMPELPLECADSADCASCFDPAYARLKDARIRFEKLRRIYQWTKNYKDQAFALGNSFASYSAPGGLAWFKERRKLEQQFQGIEASYDRKYAELLEELRASLDQIAACEASVYGEKDWYNRFGFIYFQFMADRYTRN